MHPDFEKILLFVQRFKKANAYEIARLFSDEKVNLTTFCQAWYMLHLLAEAKYIKETRNPFEYRVLRKKPHIKLLKTRH